jgi:hypothetical protein
METFCFPFKTRKWNKSSRCEFVFRQVESSMQAAVDRVMKTYGMLVNLTAQQEQVAREKVSSFLASACTDDENKLAVRACVICGHPSMITIDSLLGRPSGGTAAM